MKKVNKIIILLLIIFILAIYFFKILHQNHNCNNEKCIICVIINQTKDILKIIKPKKIVIIIEIIKITIISNQIYKIIINKKENTPVGRKVQMNN